MPSSFSHTCRSASRQKKSVFETHSMKHYGRPMDIERCKGAEDGQLYVALARPKTAASRQKNSALETCSMEERGNVVCEGRAAGCRRGSGKAVMLTSLGDMASLK